MSRVLPHTRDCSSHWDGECSCAPKTRVELQAQIDYLLGSRKRWEQEANRAEQERDTARVEAAWEKTETDRLHALTVQLRQQRDAAEARVAELEQAERWREEADPELAPGELKPGDYWRERWRSQSDENDRMQYSNTLLKDEVRGLRAKANSLQARVAELEQAELTEVRRDANVRRYGMDFAHPEVVAHLARHAALQARVAELEAHGLRQAKARELDDTGERESAYASLLAQHQAVLTQHQALKARVAELEQAIHPLAAWATAMLEPRIAEIDGTLPDRAIIYQVGEVRLTVGDLRQVIAAFPAPEEKRCEPETPAA